jgi:hypothetical protein
MKKSDIPLDDLEFSIRTLNALKKCGVTTLGQAEMAVKDGRLRKQPGIGPRAIREVLEIIYNVETMLPKEQPVEAKVHPLVELLVARAKSHPEEFVNGTPDTLSATNRWWHAVDVIRRDGTVEDNAVLDKVIGRMAMDKAHEWAMDELMNGEQRRAYQRRQAEEDAKTFQKALQAQKPTIQNLSDMHRDTQKMLNQQIRDAYAQQAQPLREKTSYPLDLLNQLNQSLGPKK